MSLKTNASNITVSPKKHDKRRLTVFNVEVVYLILFGGIVAIFGWITENLIRLVKAGFIDSRFHVLPMIPAYGLIVFAFHIILRDANDVHIFRKRLFNKKSNANKFASNMISYIIIALAVFLGELIVGNLWYALFGVMLWDYSALPLNVTRFTSIVSTLLFATIAFLFFKFAFTKFLRLLIANVSFNVAKSLSVIFVTLAILDTLAMIIHVAVTGSAPLYWLVKFR